MTSEQEVAVFIDLENLRYSLLNLYGQEPSFSAVVEKAKTYGRPSVMRAYADFAEHPHSIRQQLHIAGIEAINVNVKRVKRPDAPKGVERVKNAADMILALDAVLEASDADASSKKKTFLLVTGDADYIKLVTQLRNRFGQKVIICGVKGAIGADLISLPLRLTIWPNLPSLINSTALIPKRVPRTLSNAVGEPPRCIWPSTVTLVS